ncbi:hypothetical protein [Winogradskyella wichelsiae]|uniref:hypothetical protein n=1 Tax=Winogradskyella wichelsiae TaxID=2697007 RepID=UPI003EF191EA
MKQVRLLLFFLILALSSVAVAQSVYTTQTGEKYHKTNCRYLKYSKKEIDLKKAIALGYAACKVCKPTASNTKPSALKSSNTTPTNTASKNTTATQCTGKTKAGNRCKRKTKNSSGRCYQH